MKKKADIEIQFNWIFILIAGAVILLFFISIINNQKKVSDEKIAHISLTNLESILMGAETIPGTLHTIETPNVDIKFDCNNYYIGNTKKDIKDSVVFAPSLIKGKQMQVLTLDFDMPFRITNFVYVTHPNIRYIFVYNDSDNDSKKLIKEINSTLPDNFKREIYSNLPDPLQDKNNYKIKVVFFYNLTNIPNQIKSAGKDIGIVIVDPTQASKEIKFYNLTNNNFVQAGNSYYFDTSTLIGAIFSENMQEYNCTIQKALKKTNIVSKIYEKRVEKLINDYNELSTCYTDYENANKTIGYIKNAANDGLVESTIQNIVSYANNLKETNTDLIYKSCPTIY